jgi:hypothetical protein
VRSDSTCGAGVTTRRSHRWSALLCALLVLTVSTSCGDQSNTADQEQGSLYRIVVELEPSGATSEAQIEANRAAEGVLDSISTTGPSGRALLASISGYTNAGESELWIDFWPDAEAGGEKASTAEQREEVRRIVAGQGGVVEAELLPR